MELEEADTASSSSSQAEVDTSSSLEHKEEGVVAYVEGTREGRRAAVGVEAFLIGGSFFCRLIVQSRSRGRMRSHQTRASYDQVQKREINSPRSTALDLALSRDP